jgi:hypothetical protein
MSNPIKYSTGTESLALKKGNFYIGTGDVGKGPTSSTGYYNGISPPSGGYTIYLNKETGGPSIYTASNDAQLISLTNSIAAQSYTTANECLVYFAGQTDKMVLNRNYEGIVTDGLVCNLDAGFTPSYPKSGTTWYDVSSNGNNGTLTNGPTFNSLNGGSIDLDGSDDKVLLFSNNNFPTSYTKFCFFRLKNRNNYYNLMSASSPVDHVLWVGTFATGVYRLAGANNARSSYSEVIITTELFDNVWYCAAITFDNSTLQMKLYLNGVLGSTTTSTTISSGGICKIGEHSNGQSIAGYVPIAMVYNRALSDAEVLQNYNAQKGRFGL